MKHYKTYNKKDTKRVKRIKGWLAVMFLIGSMLAGFYQWAMYWPEAAIAEVNIPKPAEDSRTIQEHVWDIMTNEYDLTFTEKIKAMSVIDCESWWNKMAIGDSGKSLGLWQIHRGYHPDITPEECFDVYASTRWSLNKFIQDGRSFRAWTCGR